jgi:REP element-mobilizing transposase RayT
MNYSGYRLPVKNMLARDNGWHDRDESQSLLIPITLSSAEAIALLLSLADVDYRFFLECLRRAKLKCRCRIYAYVLMTNHFHLLVEPAEIGDLSRFMQSVGRRYVRHMNQTYERSARWEGRFKSAPVSRDEYLVTCGRYIELNPFRAGIVEHPKHYR